MSQDNQASIPQAPQASRRALLFGIAAVGAVASPAVASAMLEPPMAPAVELPLSAPAPATATPSPDAALLQLFDEYMATVEEYQRVYGLYESGQAKHQERYPMPDVLRVRPEDAELELPDNNGMYDGLFFSRSSGEDYDVRWVDVLRRPKWKRLIEITPPGGEPICHYAFFDPSSAARARADEIVAAYDKWQAKYWRYPRELRSIGRQADRLSKQKDKLRAKIDRTRAHTIAGLAVKAQVAAIEGEEDTQFADTTLESILRDIRKLNPAAFS
jgi:hypothetical protein